jgi:hypothetical protein
LVGLPKVPSVLARFDRVVGERISLSFRPRHRRPADCSRRTDDTVKSGGEVASLDRPTEQNESNGIEQPPRRGRSPFLIGGILPLREHLGNCWF